MDADAVAGCIKEGERGRSACEEDWLAWLVERVLLSGLRRVSLEYREYQGEDVEVDEDVVVALVTEAVSCCCCCCCCGSGSGGGAERVPDAVAIVVIVVGDAGTAGIAGVAVAVAAVAAADDADDDDDR